MSLLQEAAEFTREILEDVDTGFGQPITVTDPTGEVLELKGFANRVGQQLDPQTGLMVSGDAVSVTISMAAFPGGVLPLGINDSKSSPWLVAFADRAGVVSRWKVRETRPDKTLGVIVCLLEQWSGGG